MLIRELEAYLAKLNEKVNPDIGEDIKKRTEVKKINFVSAEEAWDWFSDVYFEGNEEAASGFSDNPLANSANYEVYVNDISQQSGLVTYLENIDTYKLDSVAVEFIKNLSSDIECKKHILSDNIYANVEEYTTKEMAQLLHISQTAVTTRVSRGREMLKTMLEEERI